LSDLVVFGKLAGDGVAAYLEEVPSIPTADDDQVRAAFGRATEVLNREEGPNPYLVHEKLHEVMHENVGIVRTGEQLQHGIAALEELKSEANAAKAPGSSQYNPAWHEALSLRSLMITSEAVARAALVREESRGAHTRLDFEGEREEGLRYNVVIRKGADGRMSVEKVERPEPPPHLAAIANATLEDLESGKVGGDSEGVEAADG
jgi:succinate dehydrogenase / fumarate reductase flavoprotein subunit